MALKNLIKPLTAADIAERQASEAQHKVLEHEAASEHHAALAAMYRARIARLGALDLRHPTLKGMPRG